MSLYSPDRRVWVRSQQCIGHVSEARYSRVSGRALYLVRLETQHPATIILATGSRDLRAADFQCDGCSRWFPGSPYATTDDGEFVNGLGFCFLCVRSDN